MSINPKQFPWLDVGMFSENQRSFPLEEREKLAGLYVAWSPDGTRALMTADEEEALIEKLDRAGIPTNQVVFGYEPPLGTTLL